ncbi:MAG: hypothetical protein HQL39_20830 [Alphaproteobacteria bacterium]|nr:hypothetical protein [Alphaproteobacteria bacterium]
MEPGESTSPVWGVNRVVCWIAARTAMELSHLDVCVQHAIAQHPEFAPCSDPIDTTPQAYLAAQNQLLAALVSGEITAFSAGPIPFSYWVGRNGTDLQDSPWPHETLFRRVDVEKLWPAPAQPSGEQPLRRRGRGKGDGEIDDARWLTLMGQLLDQGGARSVLDAAQQVVDQHSDAIPGQSRESAVVRLRRKFSKARKLNPK